MIKTVLEKTAGVAVAPGNLAVGHGQCASLARRDGVARTRACQPAMEMEAA